MAKMNALLIFGAAIVLFLGLSLCQAQDNIDPQPVPKPTTTSAPPTTTNATTTLPTKPTTPPTTTSTTTTTAKPTTSKTTTTPATTTKPPTPPTTTSTTTTPTTKKPAPKPVDPVIGTWSANYTNSNVSCVILQMAVQFEVPYLDAKDKSETGYIDIPSNATATGNCSNTIRQEISLSWTTGEGNNTFTDKITFVFNKFEKKYNLTEITANVTLDAKNFPNINGTKYLILTHAASEFKTTVDKSYKCGKLQTVNLTSSDASAKLAYLHLSHVQFQAFHNVTGKSFQSAEDCEPFDTPDIVPIAVGCALITLIIIVVIAYVIGRRRSQARGYLSMFTVQKREEDYIPMKNLSCFN